VAPRSLVTGGAGFIGSHVARELVRLGHEVVILDDLSGGSLDNVPHGARFESGSIGDRARIEALFVEHRFDYVFHLAAYAAEGLSHFVKHFNYQNNLIGSVNLIGASVNHSVKCFVFTSSIAVYGAAQMPVSESTPPRPEDPYGIAKFAVEMELEATHRMFGMDFVVFRPHNVYGEHQNIGDPYRNVIGIFMNQVLQKKPMTIFGDGTQTRAFSHVDDVAPFIARCVDMEEARNQVLNLGADTPYAVNEVARAVASAMDAPCAIDYLPARMEVLHAFSSHERFRAIYGAHAVVGLDEGVSRMAAWARRVGARARSASPAIEIARNLPPSWRQDT
jgi:UDP-glucose 4-epimerase